MQGSCGSQRCTEIKRSGKPGVRAVCCGCDAHVVQEVLLTRSKNYCSRGPRRTAHVVQEGLLTWFKEEQYCKDNTQIEKIK
jgi:hypothetical protein